MESILGPPAMSDGVGQRPDHTHEFDHRTRPAMSQDQRPCPGMRRAHVEEMDVEPVDLGVILAERIEPRLAGSPIVTVAPVADELLQFRQRRSLAPVGNCFALRPAGAIDPLCQIVERRLRNGKRKGANLRHKGKVKLFADILQS